MVEAMGLKSAALRSPD